MKDQDDDNINNDDIISEIENATEYGASHNEDNIKNDDLTMKNDDNTIMYIEIEEHTIIHEDNNDINNNNGTELANIQKLREKNII